MKTIRIAASLALAAGVLLIPAPAQADTVTVATGCEVHYDSGHVAADPNGGIDFQSPSASANTQGCYAITRPWYINLDDVTEILPSTCCVEDWLGINW